MRGNPGGLLDAAIDVCDKFLVRNSTIVTVKGRDSLNVSKYISKEEPIAKNEKLVVLINGGSASASEIVAGAIQDHDRGIIIWANSFGKGLVQTIVPLSYNTSLKFTTAKYYTPSGRCIQKIDYSKNSDLFLTKSNLTKMEFTTDNGRTVFSKGGILPDSIVNVQISSGQVRDLLFKGMFFKFASFYHNVNDNINLSNLNEKDLFESFKVFLKNEKYLYKSDSEILIDELKLTYQKEKYNGKIGEKIQELIELFKREKQKEIGFYKKQILKFIKIELASRIEGQKGMILESLKNDEQFNVALNILRDDRLYGDILGNN